MRRAAMIGDRVASNLDAHLKLIRSAIREAANFGTEIYRRR
jgi:hypothetical protein